MRVLAALLLLLLSVRDAEAGLSRAELATAEVALPPDARLDPALSAPDTDGVTRTVGEILDGRPAFLTFVDYTCTTLCGTDLALLVAAIDEAHLKPTDFRILVLGIDPKDPPEAARHMEERELPENLRQAAAFLLPDQGAVARATKALGFRYVYDAATDQFAHPAVIYLLGPDGAVRGELSPFSLTAADVGAVFGARPPGLAERIRLTCYGYDPVTGVYSLRIDAILKITGSVTLVLLGGGILLLVRRGRAP